MSISHRFSMDQWNSLMDSGQVKDISNELPGSFLMVGQIMRAKVEWGGKKWMVSGWSIGEDIWVELIEASVND